MPPSDRARAPHRRDRRARPAPPRGTCTGCSPSVTAGPPATRPPRRSVSPARWPPSTSTSWPTPASSTSPTSARRAAPGPAPVGPPSCTGPATTRFPPRSPNAATTWRVSLLAAAAEEASRTGAPIAGCLSATARTDGPPGRRRRRETPAAAPDRHDDRPADRARRTGPAWLRPELGDDDQVTLANCPFHRLAQQHRTLVCGMNLDFLRGLLDGTRSDGPARRPPRSRTRPLLRPHRRRVTARSSDLTGHTAVRSDDGRT